VSDGPPEIEDTPARYDVLQSTTAFRSGRVIDVRTDVVRLPHGDTATRDVVMHPGAVGIIAIDDNSRVLLVQQYRHPVGHVCWEPPAGLLDEAGEDPLAAAKRELFEEAHHEADRWDVLLDAFTSPGMTSEAVRIYLARDVRVAQGARHEGLHEELDMPTRWVELDAAVAAVFDGRLHNPMAAMGVLAAAHAQRTNFDGLRAADAPWPQMSQWPGSAAAAGS
jgi:8-oxo-dGTP pyrophosphatase MutT (NUDIX family)